MEFLRLSLILLCTGVLLISCKEAPHVKEEDIKDVRRLREERVDSYAPTVKKVIPAVVNIYATHHAKGEYPFSPFMQDPFFKQFYDNLHAGNGRETNSLGSGVIINKEGLVLTNAHVIENADEIQVVLSDKREYVAKILVIDQRTDLALLQLQGGKDLPFLPVKPDEDLEVGDIVLAIGNPFGVGQTVTSGIVSALARSQEGISDYSSFVQTDAAINPGNSGGALITADGRLVGINTAIYSKSGGSMGIGFAIPISLAIPVINSVKNGGRVIRPWLGLEVQSLTSEDAHTLGLPHPFGVLVKSVYPKSPADKAGVKRGDFIAAFGPHKVEDDASLDYWVAVSPLDEQTDLTIVRKGEEKKFPIVLTEPLRAEDATPLMIEEHGPLHGAKVRTLSPALALEIGLNPMTQGVVITEVSPQIGPVAQLGIQPGDILESINKHPVKTKEDVLTLLKNADRHWLFVFRRGKNILTLQVSQ
ncbi:MAG: Do family serine endopeptidase [Alphaproteobacteria bacterium]|nr:Do family serine endopeptidase [Alphaproteobacteria bacterium]